MRSQNGSQARASSRKLGATGVVRAGIEPAISCVPSAVKGRVALDARVPAKRPEEARTGPRRTSSGIQASLEAATFRPRPEGSGTGLGQVGADSSTPPDADPSQASPTRLGILATRSGFEGLEGCSRYRTGSCRPRGRLAPQTAVAIDSQLDGRDDPDGPLPFGNDGNPLDRWMVTRIVKRRRLTPALPRRRWCYAPGPRMTFAVGGSAGLLAGYLPT